MESIWHLTTDGRPARPGDEGFVHCSFTAQLEGTLALYFTDAKAVTLLRLDAGRLAGRLKLEPSRGGALFPHVYGEIVDADILARHVVRRGGDGWFDLDVLGRQARPTGNAP